MEKWEYAFVSQGSTTVGGQWVERRGNEPTGRVPSSSYLSGGVHYDLIYLNGKEVFRQEMQVGQSDLIRDSTFPTFLYEYFLKLGADGWELAVFDGGRYIFKRRKQ
jgi:hypothetical protein